ncbi:hypothetical protein GCM10007416_06920 [Kroppenstedtia guangzhouensis]|uniref:Uncharacterized protein n=1 Tax=Kroppenstedtia guangzhouensis TaxID=1274356 RepID=A0ABQ1G5R6_9BACL|nr:hypothetical protein GCM10007416_06920 [Kroppenstedtia guangzhouensis]
MVFLGVTWQLRATKRSGGPNPESPRNALNHKLLSPPEEGSGSLIYQGSKNPFYSTFSLHIFASRDKLGEGRE